MNRPADEPKTLFELLRLLAYVAIVLVGVRLAAPVIVLLLLALFFAIVLEPLIGVILRAGLPRLAGVALLSGGLLFALLYTLLNIIQALPELNQMSVQMRGLLSGPLAASLAPLKHAGVTLSPEQVMAYLDPGQMIRMASRVLSRITDIFSAMLIVFLMVLFMLLETPAFRLKTRRLLADSSPGMEALRQGIGFVSHYLAIKSAVSLVSGLIVWAALALLEVKFAFIWGVLACLLNFIPVIGSALAALPPVIQAFIFNGPGTGATVLLVFLAINLALGGLLEPYIMGRKLNLSTSAVIISLVAWDGLLGITGVLLAVPLTLSVKLALEQIPGGETLARLMAAKP